MKTKTPRPPDETYARLKRLGLHGIIARWGDLQAEPWLAQLADIEESERQRRSLERRIHNARIGSFKPLADFDWAWPKQIDREQVEDLFSFQFLRDAANVVLVGPNGIGKSMIAQNLAGYAVRFTSASAMLNELAAQDSSRSLQRRLRRYVNPTLLVVDEVGYLSYDNRHADLLFEVVTQRYQQRSMVSCSAARPRALETEGDPSPAAAWSRTGSRSQPSRRRTSWSPGSARPPPLSPRAWPAARRSPPSSGCSSSVRRSISTRTSISSCPPRSRPARLQPQPQLYCQLVDRDEPAFDLPVAEPRGPPA